MMQEIRFYQASKTPLDRALVSLVERILGTGKSVAITFSDAATRDQIDEALWQESSFLPHSVETPDPVSLINLSCHNPVGELLIAYDKAVFPIDDPRMICLLFHASNTDVVHRRRQDWSQAQATKRPLSYWAQNTDGAWEKLRAENT